MNKESQQQLVHETSEYIMNFGYGYTICHEELEEILGVKKVEALYRRLMSQIMKVCLEKSHMLVNIRGVGYKLTEPDDYGDYSIRQYKIGAKRLEKGKSILQYAPIEKMSEQGRAVTNNILEKAETLHAAIVNGVVEMNLLRKNNPLYSQFQNK